MFQEDVAFGGVDDASVTGNGCHEHGAFARSIALPEFGLLHNKARFKSSQLCNLETFGEEMGSVKLDGATVEAAVDVLHALGPHLRAIRHPEFVDCGKVEPIVVWRQVGNVEVPFNANESRHIHVDASDGSVVNTVFVSLPDNLIRTVSRRNNVQLANSWS